MNWDMYEEQLNFIMSDLLNNKQVLVIQKDICFQDVLDKLKSINPRFETNNLNFSNSLSLENDFYEENFDSIYILK